MHVSAWPNWTPRQATGQHPLVERRARKLQEAIRFRTISFDMAGKTDLSPEHDNGLPQESRNELLKLHKWIETAFPLVHKHLERHAINELSLVYIWKGKNPSKKPVMFCAHMDVVGVDETSLNQWHADPFEGAIKNDFIYGRGTLDFKVMTTICSG